MLREYFTEKATLLGYSGTAGLWITDHYEQAAGIVLSIIVIIASLILHVLKIRRAINTERRSQELHEIELKNKNINGRS